MRTTFLVALLGLVCQPAAALAQPKVAAPPVKEEPQPVEDIDNSLTYGGKTIEEWVKDIESKDYSKAEIAIRTVTMFRSDYALRAVPAIVRVLAKHSASYPIDVSLRVNGATALGAILGGAKDVDPRYIKAAVFVLKNLLRDSESLVKHRAALALAQIGPPASDALPQLFQNLNDRATWEVRQAAAFAIGVIARDEKQGPDINTINELYKALTGDRAAQVRLTAIQALTYLGPPADPQHREIVLKGLNLVAAKDTEVTVRLWATIAIMSLEGQPDQVRVRQIGELLDERDVHTRLQAISALGALGLDAKSQVGRLTACLDAREVEVVAAAMGALGRMGRWAEGAVPKLQAIIDEKDTPPDMRQMAEQVIAAIEGRTPTPKDDKGAVKAP